jgi:hypothetical protein
MFQSAARSRTRRPGSFRNALSFSLIGVLPCAAAFACSNSGEARRADLPQPFPATGSSGSSNTPQNPGASAGSSGNGANSEAPGTGAMLAGSSGAASVSSAGAPGVASGGGSGGATAGKYAPLGLISAPCPTGTAFCEDFEDDALDRVPQSPWSDATNGATARVDATHAFGGSHALHVNVPSGPPPHRGYVALQQSSFSAANREMYGRVMVWLDAAPSPASGDGVHWTLFQGEGRAATNNYNAIYRFGGELQGGAGLLANYETTQDGNPPVRSDCAQHSASKIPTQRWACFEWHFSQASNEVQYWMDGSELSDIHVIDRGPTCRYNEPPLNGEWLAPPAFQTLYMGWEQYAASTNAVDVWLDGVVVSTSRVGCPAAP